MPGLSPIAGAPPSGNALSPFSPGWKTPLTLPDLVPSYPWLNESFDSGTHGSAVSMFDRQVTWRTGVIEITERANFFL